MRLFKSRLSILERRADLAQPVEPVPVYFWPRDDAGQGVEKARDKIRTEVKEHRNAGREPIIFWVNDATRDAPDNDAPLGADSRSALIVSSEHS